MYAKSSKCGRNGFPVVNPIKTAAPVSLVSTEDDDVVIIIIIIEQPDDGGGLTTL